MDAILFYHMIYCFFLSGGLLEYWFTTCWLGFHPSRLVVMQSSKRSKLTKWSFRKNMWVARVERSVQQRLQLILSCLEDIKRSSRFCKCTSGKGGFFLYTTYIKINNSGSHEKDWNSSWCQRSDGAPLLPRNGLVRFWAGTAKPGIPGILGTRYCQTWLKSFRDARQGLCGWVGSANNFKKKMANSIDSYDLIISIWK